MSLGDDKIAEFYKRVVPWPQPGEPGVINCHYFPKGMKGKFLPGRPFTSVDGFLGFVEWAKAHPDACEEIYHCMSLQASFGEPAGRSFKAKRHRDNTLAVKSIWLDIDVSTKPEKGYKDVVTAIKALNDFVAAANLPPYSALVGSGGGLHVYWISGRDLDVDTWSAFAHGLRDLADNHGLRCDLGVTIDVVRVLRVPGTLNRKTGTPRPVRLLHLAENDLDFEAVLGHIKASPVTSSLTKPPSQEPQNLVLFDAGEAPFSFGEDLASNEYRAKLGHGSSQPTNLDFKRLFTDGGCPFFKNTLETGGANCDQGLWMLQGLATTFLHGGRKVFHALSKGHKDYAAEDTDAMFDRKDAERERDDLGWPSCLTLQRYGSKQCATCPHLSQIRSPLNLLNQWVDPKKVAEAEAFTPPPEDDQLMLPPKSACGRTYKVNDAGYIVELVEKHNKKGDPYFLEVQLLDCLVEKPWVEHSKNGLHLTVTTGLEPVREAFIPTGISGMQQKLNEHMGTNLCPRFPSTDPKMVSEFMGFWISNIKRKQKPMDIVPYGWAKNFEGFAFDGKVYMADGRVLGAGAGDSTTRGQYTVEGKPEPWFAALEMLTRQKRPALEIIAAMAFASPLVKLTGVGGSTLSALGPGGVNKSSAVKVGLAVWGSPGVTKRSPSTSTNSLLGTAGEVRNLALYWDDISDDESLLHMRKIISELTENVEGGKMKSDRSQHLPREWCLLLTVAANVNLQDNVLQHCTTDTAKAMRLFQIDVERPPENSAGQVALWEASPVFAALDENFGHVGERYAQHLGLHGTALKEIVTRQQEAFAADIGGVQPPERFWVSLCACVLIGSAIANKLGASFDIDAMRDFLIAAFAKNRKKVAGEHLEGGTKENTIGFLTEYLKETGDHTIRTKNVSQPGRYGAKETTIGFLQGPARKDTPIHVQWALEPQLLRISRKHFRAFLQEHKANVSAVAEGLVKFYNMEERRNVNLAKGCPIGNAGDETVYVIPYTGHGELEEVANAYSPSVVAGLAQ